MKSPYQLPLVALAILLAVCGTSCLPRNLAPSTPTAPPVFSGMPSLDDIVRVVNGNSQRVQRLQSTAGTLKVHGVLADLRADVALERPKRLRLRANTPLTGPELDLGSNDELFWVWIKRQNPPTIHYARHAQVESEAMRAVIPVPPSWIGEAIGLVELDPYAVHEGPYQSSPGRLEIRSSGRSRGAEATRITVIDSVYGWVLEQHLIDGRGQVLASSVMSRHQYDPEHHVTLPRRVQITIIPAELAFTLEVDEYVINQFSSGGGDSAMWTIPKVDNVEYVDLGNPTAFSPGRAASLRMSPSGLQPQSPRQAVRPWMQRYQGFSEVR